MSFRRVNIDRAIVMTQFDLRGFWHPLGFRQKYKCGAKSLNATTVNLVSFAACGKNGKPTDRSYVNFRESSFEDYLAMCKRLAKDCDLSQKESFQLIIQEIIKQSEEMKAEVATGKRDPDFYLMPIEKSNYWGKAVLALAETFEVNLKQ